MDGEEKKPFKIIKETPEGPKQDNSSRNFTGKANTEYGNGEFYEGYYNEGIREGYGIYTYANGDKYEGDWYNNLKHGIGKMTYAVEGEYFGRFENGKRHGEGIFTYKKTKDIYSGSWKYGKKCGKGSYIYEVTKMKIEGEWGNGEVKSGKWIFPNGIYFEGNFEKNKPKGEGVWHFTNGNKIKGEFSHMAGENPEGEPIISIRWSTNPEITDPTKFKEVM